MLQHLLRTADLSPGDLTSLLDLATELKAEPHRESDLLRDETVVLYFAKPSTRTRISFGAAIGRLGARTETLGPADLQLGRGETIEDTARVVSRYARAFVIRTFADEDVARFASASSVPVVNALTDGHHPCQSLADLLTLRERFGHLDGLRLAYVGDGNNVAASLLEAGALAGMSVAVATPSGYEPDPTVVAAASAAATGDVLVTSDPAEAVKGADAVYTDVWLSMGQPDEEADERRRALGPYRVDEALLEAAAPDAVFLHCLPAHRGEEVAAEVIDGPRSLVWDQAGNRLCTAQALLAALVDGRLEGAARA